MEGEAIGERGEEGLGSVDRRRVGGFFSYSVESCSLSLGTGDTLNSSILSVSGTGSMVVSPVFKGLTCLLPSLAEDESADKVLKSDRPGTGSRKKQLADCTAAAALVESKYQCSRRLLL